MREWFGKFVRGRVFAVLFCMAMLGFSMYFSKRLGRLSEGFFHVNVAPAAFVFLATMFVYMLVYINAKKAEKKTRKLFNYCGIVVCFLPSVMLCFLAFDVVQWVFGPYEGRWYLLPLLLGIGIAGCGFVHARKLVIKEYAFSIDSGSDGVPQAVTAVLLSDLHAGSYVERRQLHKMVELVNQLAPDVVFIAGDTFDHEAFGYCDMAGIQAELQRLMPRGQIYAVLGNHDPDASCQAARMFFETAGIHLLVDECVETTHFLIVGRDDIVHSPSRKSLRALLTEGNVEKPVVVIDHNPLGIAEGVEADVALLLCGHTHKGQFFPATLFTKWSYGARGFYGHFQTGKTHSVVTSGAGYFQLPIRIGTNSEIVVMHLDLQ